MDPGFIHLGRLTAAMGQRFHPHAHPFHELVLPRRGRIQAMLPGGAIEAGPGTALWYLADTIHTETVVSSEGCDWYYLALHWSGDGLGLPARIADGEGVIRQLLDLLWARQQDPSLAMQRDFLVGALTCELGSHRDHDGLVAITDRWIRAHLREHLTLEGLARQVGLSRAHYARQYRAKTGQTPMDVVRRHRLAAARDLLLTTDLPLRLIAPQVGYADEHQLSRHLGRYLGTGARVLRSCRQSGSIRD